MSIDTNKIRRDISTGGMYAEIEPMSAPWIPGGRSVERLYLNVSYVSLSAVDEGSNARFSWDLRYPVVIDEETTNWFSIGQTGVGDMQLPITDVNIPAIEAIAILFDTIVTTGKLDITYK